MSHASCIVAVDGSVERDQIEQDVARQLAPFEEGASWFEDGSRWDWYTIGGRYESKLDPAYDPSKDPRNLQTCDLCGGTGKRDDDLGRRTRAKDPSYGCNGCNDTGTMRKFHNEFTGRAVKRRGDLTEAGLRMGQVVMAERIWGGWEAEKKKDTFMRKVIYGLAKDETRESLIKKMEGRILSAYAFLKDRVWHEEARLGWFGESGPSEGASGKAHGITADGRIVVKSRKHKAQIVTYGNGKTQDEDEWSNLYWARFIRPLPAEAWLVVVDYHI